MVGEALGGTLYNGVEAVDARIASTLSLKRSRQLYERHSQNTLERLPQSSGVTFTCCDLTPPVVAVLLLVQLAHRFQPLPPDPHVIIRSTPPESSFSGPCSPSGCSAVHIEPRRRGLGSATYLDDGTLTVE